MGNSRWNVELPTKNSLMRAVAVLVDCKDDHWFEVHSGPAYVIECSDVALHCLEKAKALK